MRHLREDYDSIQPWPIRRPHHGKDADGNLVMNAPVEQADSMLEPIIPDDEPVFLLRANDPVAAAVVHFWADQAQGRGADELLVERVHDWADHMDDWCATHSQKLTPDSPDGLLRDPNAEIEVQ